MPHKYSHIKKSKFIDDFNRCSEILSEPKPQTQALFIQFCLLLGITDTAGKLFFWMVSHHGTEYPMNIIAADLGTSEDEISIALDVLTDKRMVEDLSEWLPMEVCDVTDQSIAHTQNLYCFKRLLTI